MSILIMEFFPRNHLFIRYFFLDRIIVVINLDHDGNLDVNSNVNLDVSLVYLLLLSANLC